MTAVANRSKAPSRPTVTNPTTIPNFYTSLALLIVGGFGLAGFGTMQVALLLVETPAHLRARILGLLTVCIGMGPVGVLHIGYMAERFGTVVGLVTVGLEGTLLLLATAVIWPELRKD